MPPILTVEQAKNKVIQLAISEKDLTSWKDKTKITVKGVISKVGEPRNEGKYRDVWLKQKLGDDKLAFLKVTVSKTDWRDDVNKLGEKDVGTEQTFTGVASQWEDRASGEIIYSLYGEIGEGSRSRSGGGRNWNPRAPIVGMLFNQGMASFKPIDFLNGDWDSNVKELGQRFDCVIRAITSARVEKLVAVANVTQKTEAKTEESEETTADPFEG